MFIDLLELQDNTSGNIYRASISSSPSSPTTFITTADDGLTGTRFGLALYGSTVVYTGNGTRFDNTTSSTVPVHGVYQVWTNGSYPTLIYDYWREEAKNWAPLDIASFTSQQQAGGPGVAWAEARSGASEVPAAQFMQMNPQFGAVNANLRFLTSSIWQHGDHGYVAADPSTAMLWWVGKNASLNPGVSAINVSAANPRNTQLDGLVNVQGLLDAYGPGATIAGLAFVPANGTGTRFVYPAQVPMNGLPMTCQPPHPHGSSGAETSTVGAGHVTTVIAAAAVGIAMLLRT